jgi:hypothetical protein
MSSQVSSIRVDYGLLKQVAFVRVMSLMPQMHLSISTSSNHHFGHDRPYTSPNPSPLTWHKPDIRSYPATSRAAGRKGLELRREALPPVPPHRYRRAKSPELQTDTRLQPLSALTRLAIVRAGQDHADTRHGKIFRREATGAAQRARLGRAGEGIAKR